MSKQLSADNANITVQGVNIAAQATTLPIGGQHAIHHAATSLSNQLVYLSSGEVVSTDEFDKMVQNVKGWMKLKEIVEAHQIIEELPDGDIVIRIKRAKVERAHMAGQNLPPSAFTVDFGVEDEG